MAVVVSFAVLRKWSGALKREAKLSCYGALVPVNTTHADYDSFSPYWLRARDVFAGEDAVKSANIRYLPRLDSQLDDEYAAYKARASFFNATARTADGFLGLIFRREPTVKLPGDGTEGTNASNGSGVGAALKLFSEDVDLVGTSLYGYSKNVVSEVITVGRAGTLIDWESASRTGERGKPRAYVVQYMAEQILNWRMERINGRNVVTMVALSETVEMPGEKDDEFDTQMIDQIRVLKLVGAANVPLHEGERQPHYAVEIWREEREDKGRRGKKKKWVLVESRIPLRLGKPLPLIPFVFHGPRHSLPQVEKLPLADIIAVNLDHYRLNADYKHGLHFTALPTAWVSGFDKSAELRIGSSTAWVTDVVGATAGFLEFKGSGLETFERAMDRDERLMAILGSRMLEAPKRVGETAEAIELRQSGENSVLMTLALSVSDSMTQVLRWVYWWNSTEAFPEDIGEDVVLLQLNTDFTARGLQSDEITSIVSAWQAGAISQATMFDLFRRGEVLPVGRTDEEEARLAEAGNAEKLKTEMRKSGVAGAEGDVGTNKTQSAN